VNVIVSAADFVAGAFDLAADAGEVLEKFLFYVDVDPRVAILRAKHEMQNYIG
jgi:hypothetical protein